MPTVLVTGATGQQGGGVIDALLTLQDPNLQIRALTRRPNSAAAKALAAQGVQTVQGDLQSGEGISAALTGCDAAHLVTDFRGPEDVPGEIRQGKIFVDKAKEVGLKHLVFSSVAGADFAQPVEHFYSKFQIEEYIRESGLSWTVVRPCGFLEVIPPPGLPRALMLGAFAATMGSGSHPYVSCVDIGRMIARALLEPDKFSGKIINLAGQRATVDELQDALARGAGTRSWRIWVPRWLVLLLSPYHYKQMFEWLGSVVQPGDPEECRQILGSVLNIEEWSRKQKASADTELAKKNK